MAEQEGGARPAEDRPATEPTVLAERITAYRASAQRAAERDLDRYIGDKYGPDWVRRSKS